MKIIILLLISGIISACGGSSSGEEASAMSVDPTLTQSAQFTGESGTTTVNYPEGWTVDQAFGEISFINSGDVESLEVSGVTDGIVSGIITVAAAQGQTLDSIAERLGGTELSSPGGSIGQPQRITINGREALLVSAFAGEMSGANENTRRETIFLPLGDNYMVFVTTIGTVNTLNQVRDTLQAIAAGVNFTPSGE